MHDMITVFIDTETISEEDLTREEEDESEGVS